MFPEPPTLTPGYYIAAPPPLTRPISSSFFIAVIEAKLFATQVVSTEGFTRDFQSLMNYDMNVKENFSQRRRPDRTAAQKER